MISITNQSIIIVGIRKDSKIRENAKRKISHLNSLIVNIWMEI